MDADCSSDTPHRLLHRETRAWHERVERAFDRFDLGRTEGLDGYLSAQGAAVLSAEHALDLAGAGRILPDWPDRRRGPALEADLAERGLTPSGPVRGPDLSTLGRVFGALYVLEGSRLGAKVLARRAKAGQNGRTSRFLDHDAGPGAWPRFLAVLNAAACLPAELIAGANETFSMFHDAASLRGTEAGAPLSGLRG